MDRTESKAFFPLSKNVISLCLFCCPPLKPLLAVEFWLVGVAGARNYLLGKNLILPSPPSRLVAGTAKPSSPAGSSCCSP